MNREELYRKTIAELRREYPKKKLGRKRGFRIKRAELDPHAATELDLYIENDSDLYRQKQAILKNLQLKARRGIYDKSKAAKLWGYWVQTGARKYVKEFASGPIQNIFNKTTREHVANELAARYPEGKEN